ncbi:MAG: stage 0 sporulation family protein [Candidatus Omnitrophica bacterium]|nr:stage 0 sporulation family protein [Candidatus Omnitrophota bacterium]
MPDKVHVRIREFGPINCFKCSNLRLNGNEVVILEAERGVDYGRVIIDSSKHLGGKLEVPLRKIIRIATKSDLEHIKKNNAAIKGVIDTCLKKIEEHKLAMKLIEAEHSFDKGKLIFYFTSEGRVDFRELVKDLAKLFKTRIELRQIGVRDEAKMFGGYGCCGRELCCVRFLREFEPVSIKMAKEQHLPLNPPKISGLCGRLMCCLSYEHHTYREITKDLPREGERLNTPEGRGKVISVNPLTRKVIVEVEKGRCVELKYGCRHG